MEKNAVLTCYVFTHVTEQALGDQDPMYFL